MQPRNPLMEVSKQIPDESAASAPVVQQPSEWPDLVLFEEGLYGHECPVDVFPDAVRQHIREVSESTQVPLDMAAVADLGALAAVCAPRAVVQIGETHEEPLNVFLGLFAEPGERKSYVLRAARKPLDEIQKELAEESKQDLAENHQRREMSAERLRDIQKRAAKCDDEAERASLLREATQLERDTPEEMAPPAMFVGDVTNEALQVVLAEQRGCVAMLIEEGGTLLGILTGRYDRNGSANLDTYLNGYDGGPIDVRRLGRQSRYVESPALTVCAMFQPILAEKMTECPDIKGRGLLGRFGLVWPESKVGSRLYRNRPVSAEAREGWRDTLRDIWKIPRADPRKRLLVEGQALEVWTRYADELEISQRDGGPLDSVRDWASKHAARVARIAGILHLAQYADTRTHVEADTMRRAVQLGRWLTAHALVVFARMGADAVSLGSKRALQWIESRRPEKFTRSELHQQRFKKQKPAEVEPYLKELMQRGYIRKLAPKTTAKGGRPTQVYEVNPAYLSGLPRPGPALRVVRREEVDREPRWASEDVPLPDLAPEWPEPEE